MGDLATPASESSLVLEGTCGICLLVNCSELLKELRLDTRQISSMLSIRPTLTTRASRSERSRARILPLVKSPRLLRGETFRLGSSWSFKRPSCLRALRFFATLREPGIVILVFAKTLRTAELAC